MLQEAKDLQNNAVEELYNHVININENDIVFKAPTGVGKTYIMASLVDKILSNQSLFLKNYDTTVNGVVFLISSLSRGNLAQQNYEKFCEYSDKKFFNNLEPYLINSEIAGEERLFIPPTHNAYFLPRDLYKKNSRLMSGAMEAFLENLSLPTNLGGQGKKIILIKDECHIATRNLDSLNNYFEKVINFSATPNLRRGQRPTVEISENDAVNAKIIKSVEWGNEADDLRFAIKKYEKIKSQYISLLGVNPCLIIQISNKDKADEEVKKIIPELENHNLKWMLIVDKDKDCDTNDFFKAKKMPVAKWTDYAKENTSNIDVIIFKMVITEGFDIPRACMLYQVRDVQSPQLEEQVIGRVRRNPKLLDYEKLLPEAQVLATTAWIWGQQPNEGAKWFPVKLKNNCGDITKEVKVKTTSILTLSNKNNFDVDKFMEKQTYNPHNTSIFELGRKILKASSEVQNIIYDYATNYQKWWDIAETTDKLEKESQQYICDYEQSMELTKENGKIKETSFPLTSQYLDNNNYENIDYNVWKRNDGKNKFAFDSDAEREWADVLDKISENSIAELNKSQGDLYQNKDKGDKIYLWGKNYIPNSEIKFEYYMGSVHSSYPDFVMKDKKGRIHIFEVKSVNEGSIIGFDNTQYISKIAELKKAYKQASKLTGHLFYLPLTKNDVWQISCFENGIEKNLTLEEFKKSL